MFAPTRIIDVDSHEMIPMHMWPEAFGEESAAFAPLASGLLSKAGENSTVRDDIAGDVTPIDDHSVWNVRGPDAPGAIDMSRRTAVLDTMGIDRQLVFPTFALFGISLLYNTSAPEMFQFDPAEFDHKAAGRSAIAAHNRWAARTFDELGADRVRPVSIVLTESVEGMITAAEEAIAAGLRALWIPSGLPPAGLSPAHRALDPFWSVAAAADIPVLLHIGTEFALIDPRWYADVPEFSYGASSSIEFPVEPYRAATLNLTCEAFLTAMILGGVFERHPSLRFGVIECGAQWVGPLAERLDVWARQFGRRLENTLTMRPSEYLARNVRVTPFVFEPVSQYYERHPDLADVYCYSSDYPHREGGRESKQRFLEELAPLGDDVCEKFFVSNGSYILPV